MTSDAYRTFLVVFFLILAVGFAIAFLRKGKVASARLGGRRLEILTAADPQTVFDRIAAMRDKFRADDSDRAKLVVVLASSVSLASWGFTYPVFIHPAGTGSRIEVGCHSKFIQVGPVVGKWHRECVSAIEQALSIPAARVA